MSSLVRRLRTLSPAFNEYAELLAQVFLFGLYHNNKKRRNREIGIFIVKNN